MQEQCFPFPILQCMQYLWEPAQWYGCQCLICTQMWMPALAHGGCMNTIRESTLTADCEKIPCCTGELNPFWYCIWLLVHYTHFGIASGFWSTVPILVLHLAFGPLNLFWYCVWLLVHWTHFGIASGFWSTEPILVLRLACGPTLPTELFLPPPPPPPPPPHLFFVWKMDASKWKRVGDGKYMRQKEARNEATVHTMAPL